MFKSIKETDFPSGALLLDHDENMQPAMADCFSLTLNKNVTIASFLAAFYTSKIFKIERKILAFALQKPSTDEQAIALSKSQRDTFAIWTQAYRDNEQIVLSDFKGSTKSWLMVKQITSSETQIFFGTAVMPTVKKDGSLGEPSKLFVILGSFHRLYSKLLLWSAAKVLVAADVPD